MHFDRILPAICPFERPVKIYFEIGCRCLCRARFSPRAQPVVCVRRLLFWTFSDDFDPHFTLTPIMSLSTVRGLCIATIEEITPP